MTAPTQKAMHFLASLERSECRQKYAFGVNLLVVRQPQREDVEEVVVEELDYVEYLATIAQFHQ
jgi:hypothetical protein